MHHGARRRHAVIFVALATAWLAACGDGGAPVTPRSSATPPSATPPSAAAPPRVGGTANTAPVISGKPPESTLTDRIYSFTPLAADKNGDALTFRVANAPSWTTFDTRTGTLKGAPAAHDVGKHSSIAIFVTDGKITVSLPPFSITVTPVASGSATLSWMPPDETTAGDPLTNLAGFNIYWGTEIGDYPNVAEIRAPGLSSYVIEHLTPATWYFVLTAVSASGMESAFSNVASKTIR
jgi:hypothetical protein